VLSTHPNSIAVIGIAAADHEEDYGDDDKDCAGIAEAGLRPEKRNIAIVIVATLISLFRCLF
jgi:hypothetical protein